MKITIEEMLVERDIISRQQLGSLTPFRMKNSV